VSLPEATPVSGNIETYTQFCPWIPQNPRFRTRLLTAMRCVQGVASPEEWLSMWCC